MQSGLPPPLGTAALAPRGSPATKRPGPVPPACTAAPRAGMETQRGRFSSRRPACPARRAPLAGFLGPPFARPAARAILATPRARPPAQPAGLASTGSQRAPPMPPPVWTAPLEATASSLGRPLRACRACGASTALPRGPPPARWPARAATWAPTPRAQARRARMDAWCSPFPAPRECRLGGPPLPRPIMTAPPFSARPP